jgi:6-phosphogluconate dehydrogenase
VDVGTSGGVWGLERGYCMMIGGENEPRCSGSIPFSPRWRPGIGDIPRTPGRESLGRHAEQGLSALRPERRRPLRQDGPQRHRVRHDGRLRRGLEHLRAANIGKKQTGEIDAETTPLRDPEHYQYDLNLRDIAEVWRRGSVIASWLLDLTAASALVKDPATRRNSPAESPIPAKAAGRSRRPSTKACRCRC